MEQIREVRLSKDNIILITVAGIASYLDAALLVSLGVALPIWAKYLNLNSWLIGFVSTLLTLAVAIGSSVGGWLSDKFGRVTVFNLDILFVAIGSLIIAFSHNVMLLLIGVTIAGLASGADLPTSLAVISERMSKKAYGRAVSATQIFWTIGILLSQFIGFVTADGKMISPLVLFGWIALVAFINWCVRAFSQKFKRLEKQLLNNAGHISTEYNSKEKNGKISTIQILKNNKLLLPLFLLTVFYLFWNLPANTWGSFVNYYIVTVGRQSQAYSTLIALVANVLCLLVNFIYLKISDSRYRYLAMYLGIVIAFLSFIAAAVFSNYYQIFTIAYILYSGSTVLCGETLYKIWSQSFYPVNVRASLTGFSYGIVRCLTACFSLITPTLMAASPQKLMWVLVGCTAVFGTAATIIVHLVKNNKVKDLTRSQM